MKKNIFCSVTLCIDVGPKISYFGHAKERSLRMHSIFYFFPQFHKKLCKEIGNKIINGKFTPIEKKVKKLQLLILK